MTTIAPRPSQSAPVNDPTRHQLPYPKVAAAIATLIGMFVTALGAGIGIRYLSKTGLTWTAAAGLVLLLAGLALLGFAAAVTWRRAHRWRRLWFLPAGVVALMLMWSLAEGTMLAFAPRTPLGSVTPAERGFPYSDVVFRTRDGVTLSAWYLPGSNRAAVVTVPGSGSSRTATLDQAAVLARHGYGVLMLDPRGQGRSGGHAMDAGWYGERDVAAAVAFLAQQPLVDPAKIGVLGLSMGGEEAIGAAAADPAIRAVVAEGATHRTAADKAGYLPGGISGALQRGLDQLTYGTAALLSGAPEPGTLHRAIERATTTRYFLIAAGKGVDEPDAVAYLRSAAPDRVQTWTVPGAAHTHGLATAPAQWQERVIAFLDSAFGISRR